MLMDDPSLSEHIEGLMGLLLGGRLHMETGRLQEGIVFGGGMIVEDDDGSEPTFPSLIVRFLVGKLSHRSRLMGIPTVGERTLHYGTDSKCRTDKSMRNCNNLQ